MKTNKQNSSREGILAIIFFYLFRERENGWKRMGKVGGNGEKCREVSKS